MQMVAALIGAGLLVGATALALGRLHRGNLSPISILTATLAAAGIGLLATFVILQRYADLVPDGSEDSLVMGSIIAVSCVLALIGLRRATSRQ